jgi:hypothetical protein
MSYQQEISSSVPPVSSVPAPEEISCTKKFDSSDKLKDSVEKWLTSWTADFYEHGIQNLVPRNNKQLNVGDDYIKK